MKKIYAGITGLLLAVSAAGSVAQEQLTIKGVSGGSPKSEVARLYGQPLECDQETLGCEYRISFAGANVSAIVFFHEEQVAGMIISDIDNISTVEDAIQAKYGSATKEDTWNSFWFRNGSILVLNDLEDSVSLIDQARWEALEDQRAKVALSNI